MNAGATVTPASGETVDLSASWTNGVTFKSTMGSSSSTYTVQIRNKSKDTSITSFVIPDGQLKYQSKNGAVAATINGTLINLMMEYGNTTSQQTLRLQRARRFLRIRRLSANNPAQSMLSRQRPAIRRPIR